MGVSKNIHQNSKDNSVFENKHREILSRSSKRTKLNGESLVQSHHSLITLLPLFSHQQKWKSLRSLAQSQFEGSSTGIMFSCENPLKTEALEVVMPHVSMYSLYKSREKKLTQYKSDITKLKLMC